MAPMKRGRLLANSIVGALPNDNRSHPGEYSIHRENT